MPLEADLRGLGPFLLQVGTHEMLLNDTFALAERLRAHDVPVWVQVWHKAMHTFQLTFDVNPDARRAVDEVTRSSATRRPWRTKLARNPSPAREAAATYRFVDSAAAWNSLTPSAISRPERPAKRGSACRGPHAPASCWREVRVVITAKRGRATPLGKYR